MQDPNVKNLRYTRDVLPCEIQLLSCIANEAKLCTRLVVITIKQLICVLFQITLHLQSATIDVTVGDIVQHNIDIVLQRTQRDHVDDDIDHTLQNYYSVTSNTVLMDNSDVSIWYYILVMVDYADVNPAVHGEIEVVVATDVPDYVSSEVSTIVHITHHPELDAFLIVEVIMVYQGITSFGMGKEKALLT